MKIRRAYVDTRLGQTHIRIARPPESGARPILCVHPQPLSGRALEPLLAALGHTRLTVAVDIPGFGMSDAPARPPSLDDYLGVLTDVADALALAPYDLLGWLTGARLVVPLAAAQPGAVRRVVLIGAGVIPPEQRAALPPHSVPTPLRDGSHLIAEWQRWMTWWPPETPLQVPSDLFADTLQGIGHPQRAWIVDVTRTVLHEQYLPHLLQPVLVVNPAGPMHESTARVAPYLRDGRIITTAQPMFPLLTTPHVDDGCRLITEFLD